jgi:6-phosphofructokinase 2
MKKIVTLTMNPAIDKSATADNVAPEKKIRCTPPRYEPGGGGINVSRAIRHLGGESVAVYPAGGTTGQMFQELMAQEKLEQRVIPVKSLTRENLVIYEESTGQQFRFVMPGMPLDEEEWRKCLDVIPDIDAGPDYIVVSGSLPADVPDDVYLHIARMGTELGARVVLDTSGVPLRRAVEHGVYLVKPNMREFSELVGRQLKDEIELEGEAKKLIEKGQSEIVVISLGAGGILAVWAGGCERIHSPTVPIKSKVGAGDSMVAGIVLSLARDWNIYNALCYGVAAGAAAVMTPGTALCRLEDTERLYHHMMVKKGVTDNEK